jgi:hypothetical protein
LAFPWDGALRYMIRDRDRIYGTVVEVSLFVAFLCSPQWRSSCFALLEFHGGCSWYIHPGTCGFRGMTRQMTIDMLGYLPAADHPDRSLAPYQD